MRGHATQGRLTRLVGILLALAGLSVGAGAARAEFFNIKYGTDFGNPSPAYGGAANQPGFWTNQPIATGVQQLRDLGGNLTNVTIELSGIFYPFSFDNPGPQGDERALMNSYVGLGFPGDSATFRIRGLAAGDYDLITYAWGSDNAAYRTGISPNGLPEQSVGGPWPGGQVLGVTYADHQVHLGAGEDLVVTATTRAGFGSVNGLQIAPPSPAPEPGTLALAGVGAGLMLLVRRRRPRAA
jgi:hypothetical protein